MARLARQDTLARAIQVSEERYRLLADNVTDIILKHDLDWRIDYVSPSVRQLGYRPEELIGAVHMFTHPDEDEALRGRPTGLLEGRSSGSFEARVRRADGGWMWIEAATPRGAAFKFQLPQQGE